jgi:hypothetical protein
VDDGLSAPEINAIERDVRQRSDDPIVGISFERKRSGRIDHAAVQVRLLDRCDDTSAEGRVMYFRRVKGGWRLDRGRNGRWSSVTQVVY